MVHGGNVPSVEEGSTPKVAADPVLESIPYRVGAKRCLWRGGSCQAGRCCPDFVDDPGTRVAPRGGPGRPHEPTPSQPCHVHCVVMRALPRRTRSGTHKGKRTKLYGFEFGNKMNEIRLRGLSCKTCPRVYLVPSEESRKHQSETVQETSLFMLDRLRWTNVCFYSFTMK